MAQEMVRESKKLDAGSSPVYRRPPWIMRYVFDPFTRVLVGRLGVDDHNGTRVLEVRGRSSGRWRTTPVKLLELEGRRYLVAMYGDTSWARNLRAQRGGRLRLGSQITTFRAVELAGAETVPILRAYFRPWWSLVRRMTPVTSPNAPDEEISRAAALYPVFRLEE